MAAKVNTGFRMSIQWIETQQTAFFQRRTYHSLPTSALWTNFWPTHPMYKLHWAEPNKHKEISGLFFLDLEDSLVVNIFSGCIVSLSLTDFVSVFAGGRGVQCPHRGCVVSSGARGPAHAEALGTLLQAVTRTCVLSSHLLSNVSCQHFTGYLNGFFNYNSTFCNCFRCAPLGETWNLQTQTFCSVFLQSSSFSSLFFSEDWTGV